jgi:hypothetical protein
MNISMPYATPSNRIVAICQLFAGTAPLRGALVMIMSATEWRGASKA